MDKSLSIVILAAGLGTRMKSRRAKVLHEAGGMTLIARVLETALEVALPENVVVVVGHQAEELKTRLAPYGVSFALQAQQKGTGHAVMASREQLGARPGRVVILYGDCPLLRAETIRRLVDEHAASGCAATVITAALEDPAGYGRILLDARGNVGAIVEQKAATPEQLAVKEINSGIYCFDAPHLWPNLDEIRTDNPAGEYYLTDIVAILHRQGHVVRPMHLDDASEILGINTRVELAGVDRLLRAETARKWMLAGVTIQMPETVRIDAKAQIGMDTVVEPFAQILGTTRIGENCRIGAGSVIRDSVLADDVEIEPYSFVGTSTLAPGVKVGPFARLRMDNTVEQGAQVGNFVELKKTRLGAGAKAMHLAYLGDSSIGAGVNIGAGTITCNYDGEKKHPTVIGDRCFVGSNSTLVAPVELNADSYVAAGSVITETVPAEALGLGRARQVNKEGWVRQRRESRKARKSE